MKRKIFPMMMTILLLIVGLSNFNTVEAKSQPVAKNAESHKILIAYFTWSGTTQKIAEKIQAETGGKLFRIEPMIPYPTVYKECTDKASKEVASNARPEIKNKVEDMDTYDVIFLGYPIWWYNAPMIIDTFLESYEFSGKTVIPFCTSGGSPIGVSMDKIKLHCPDSDVKDGLTANGKVDIKSWIAKLGFNDK